MVKKRRIVVESYTHQDTQKCVGRCIGLLTDIEFDAVVNNPELQKKLITVGTEPLINISNVEEIKDLRLALVTKTKGNTALFITEAIDMVSQFISPDNLILIGVNGSYITITEEVEEEQL